MFRKIKMGRMKGLSGVVVGEGVREGRSYGLKNVNGVPKRLRDFTEVQRSMISRLRMTGNC